MADDSRRRGPAAPSSRRGAILLVDDNAVNRRVAGLMLVKAGYEVEEACDGAQAAELALQRRYDLILMDVQMPNCTGYEATRLIRAREGEPRTPILAMTARAMDADVQDCLRAGMDGYVSKPVREPALLAAVESWIANAAQPLAPGPRDSRLDSGGRPALAPTALAELRAYGGEGDSSIVVELATLFFRGAAEHLQAIREAAAAPPCICRRCAKRSRRRIGRASNAPPTRSRAARGPWARVNSKRVAANSRRRRAAVACRAILPRSMRCSRWSKSCANSSNWNSRFD
jgi:CheY-like chemotaxis protein